MRPFGQSILVLGLVIALGGCGSGGPQTADSADGWQSHGGAFENVRGTAVAGLFYPRHAEDLTETVDAYLDQADPESIEGLRGLVCPHAGYPYSGVTAAFGYKLLAGRNVQTVIVMGPSHYATFRGASIPEVEAYATPLGLIPLSPKAAALGKLAPLVVNPRCQVRRPPREQWIRAPMELPPFGEDTPHSWEHSVEVQLPFLQRVLGEFELVPIVFGNPSSSDQIAVEPEEAVDPDEAARLLLGAGRRYGKDGHSAGEIAVDPEEVARVLLEHLDDTTLLVASSDLSYRPDYESVNSLDSTCCQAICRLNTDWMQRLEAYGKGPILTLMHIARAKGWRAKLLDYRNSGDVTGDKSGGVVGYAAIAFYDPGDAAEPEELPALPGPGRLAERDQRVLLELARQTITEAVTRRSQLRVPMKDLSEELRTSLGCFVTLNKSGRRRGCIGDIFPRRPLFEAVVYSAATAATADTDFPPVRPDELDQIEIEISLLSLPTQLEFDSPAELLDKLRPGIDGVVLCVGQNEATYLPQIWDEIPRKQDFLASLAEKAGLPRSGWKDPKARILIYQADVLHESSQK